MTEKEQIRKKANTYFFSKVAFNAVLMVIGAVVIALFLTRMQNQTSLYRQKENSEQALTEVVRVLESNRKDTKELTEIFHEGNQSMLQDLRELLTSGMFDFLTTVTEEERVEVFDDIIGRSGIDYLFIMDGAGNILLSQREEYIGVNLTDVGLLTAGQLQDLIIGTAKKDGSIMPVYVKSLYGNFYFYSTTIRIDTMTIQLILGANADHLDVQIESLQDISQILRRTAISNDGFLFAVEPTTGTFIYYENGGDVLTGKNAYDVGVQKEALLNGYSGMQNIMGKQYYCVSREFNGTTYICAVAETAKIFSNNRYVLFWSITGYVLVMLLCLSYAIIVRNDFVRNVTLQNKKIFKTKNGEIILNLSVFRKVFPLMVFGVLIIFCISFYSQTLLEISESAERSAIALDDINGRYEESQRNRAIIEDYYEQRFVSTAKMFSYLLEEDPSVLNQKTDRQYTLLNKDGQREFLYDGEGNILCSVASSSRLQELCDNNDIYSVYVFDDNGRTIATNTTDWFFTLSTDPEDQSYAFQSVLDGKTDELIQNITANDSGEQAQYVGVAFHYYTTLDEEGNTVYLSRAQAQGLTGETFPNPVHAHRSLLQVEVSEELVERVLSTTDVSSILSSEMLNGGFVLLYDDSEEHNCIYSPNRANIGKPAAELGVSQNIFSGNDYYGFTRISGERHFQYFRYSGNYFAGTSIPTRTMYSARLPVALVTTLISLAMILILSGTVTLTTNEEEYLYATMGETQEEDGLDSKIFNIILPSGKIAATTKAASRWDNRMLRWYERSPEQKLLHMLSILGGILVFYVAITVLGANHFFEDDSIIRYILSGNWDRGMNVFALSACAIILVFVSVVITFFHIPASLISSLLGARGETVSHLAVSVVKYGGALGAVFYSFYLLGMDPTNLLVSAGVLSLVIGLGAQSLINDILAGVFIVFEGEFRVGDIVTIGGFRGTVIDIGLRTTKIMAADGNIKIYNNSEISGILNMTKETSVAAIIIGIEYSQDINYVEQVLYRELPALADKNPAILEGPTYSGITELGESSVNLRITARTNEQDVWGVRMYLNREVLQIFKENGINVPFKNVTLSYLEPPKKTTRQRKKPIKLKDATAKIQSEVGGLPPSPPTEDHPEETK